MALLTRRYTLCQLSKRRWTYRVRALWPRYSVSPAWFGLSDNHGNFILHASSPGWHDGRPMDEIELTKEVDLESGHHELTLDYVLPDDASYAAGWVEFDLLGNDVRRIDTQADIPPGCYAVTGPPPEGVNTLSFNIHDRECQAKAARIVEAAYIPDGITQVLLAPLGLPGDEISSLEIDDRPGSGTWILKNPKRALVFTVGTTNSEQLATQAIQMMAGPQFKGAIGSTADIWWTGSDLVMAEINNAGIAADTPLVLCGHSMGGCIACVAAARLRRLNPDRTIEILTFGRPRPGDRVFKAFLSKLNQCHLAVIDDIVPKTCPHLDELGYLGIPFQLGFREMMDAWVSLVGQKVLHNDGHIEDGETLQLGLLIDLANVVFDLQRGNPVRVTSAHAMDNYASLLEINPMP